MTDSLEGLPVGLRKAVKTRLHLLLDMCEHSTTICRSCLNKSWLSADLAAKKMREIKEAGKGLIIDILKKYAPEFTEDGDAKKAMKIIKVELKKVEEAFG